MVHEKYLESFDDHLAIEEYLQRVQRFIDAMREMLGVTENYGLGRDLSQMRLFDYEAEAETEAKD